MFDLGTHSQAKFMIRVWPRRFGCLRPSVHISGTTYDGLPRYSFPLAPLVVVADALTVARCPSMRYRVLAQRYIYIYMQECCDSVLKEYVTACSLPLGQFRYCYVLQWCHQRWRLQQTHRALAPRHFAEIGNLQAQSKDVLCLGGSFPFHSVFLVLV